MRPADCILVRVGEIALKSKQVQKKFSNILLENMKAALSANGVEFNIEANPNRFFVYTTQIKEAVAALKKVFGLTSISPAWVCFANLEEMNILASDVGRGAGLNEKKSFAIRARTAGRHRFSSRIIAEEVGAAVKRATGARVDLTNPDVEIFVECRSRHVYIFTEKFACAGGMPVGTAGRVIAVMHGKHAEKAAQLAAKRGCELTLVFCDRINEKVVKKLLEWHAGREMRVLVTPCEGGDKMMAAIKYADSIAAKEGAAAIITAEHFQKITKTGLEALRKRDMAARIPIFRPILLA